MDMKFSSVCVAGGGSWGTALAHVAACGGHATTLYLRDETVCRAINEVHVNPRYLPSHPVHPDVAASTDPAVLGAPLVVLAIPCQQQRAFLAANACHIAPTAVIVNVAKGIELTTLRTCSALAAEALPRNPFAVLSGPSFAREVMEGQPTAVVVASRTPGLAEALQQFFSTPVLRCYTSGDVTGVEIGGAVKNIIAIAAGLCDGLGIGTNGRAALVTRGLAEITRLGVAMGAKPLTFMGLSGLGDLVLTTTGDLSRNRQVGLSLGRGEKLSDITARLGMVAEGVKTAFAVRSLAGTLGVAAPITTAVCAILEEKVTAREAAHQLMSRSLRRE